MDALDAFRAAIAATGDTSSIALLTAEGQAASSIAEAAMLQLGQGQEQASFPRSAPTRIATNKTAILISEPLLLPTPESDPAQFLPLDALYVAIQTKDESSGNYVRLVLEAGVARLPITERQEIIDYLLGKRHDCAGVLSLDRATAAAAAKRVAQGVPSTDAIIAAAQAKGGAPTDLPAGAAQTSTTPPGSPSQAHKDKYGKFAAASAAAAAAAAAAAPTGLSATAVATTAAGTKRAYVVNKADAEYCKRLKRDVEVVLRTRNDAMAGTGSLTADFGFLRTQIAQRMEVMKRIVQGGSAGAGKGGASGASSLAGASTPGSTAGSVASSGGFGARKVRAQDPIIVLSNSPTAMINMFNVKAFLEDGVFIPPELARKDARSIAEPIVSVRHRVGQLGGVGAAAPGSASASAATGADRPIRFLIVDNAEALKKLGGSQGGDPWARVVGVFTTGQEWQFKSYPAHLQQPSQLFRVLLGLYVRWKDEPPHANVANWNVKTVEIDRNKRHADKQIASHFWRLVEAWMEKNRKHLLG